MDPYEAEYKGMSYKDFSTLQRLADENGYVNPYHAEASGVPYSAWALW